MKPCPAFVLAFSLSSLGRVSAPRAGGYDLSPPGAVALGRSGAVAGSDDTPLALANNPAWLALQRTATTVVTHLVVSDVCFDRWETTGPRGEVCNGARLTPSPSAALTLRLRPGLSLGLGIVAPVAAGRADFEGSAPPLDNPARYALAASNSRAAYPTVGVGYAVHPLIRVGAAFSAGMVSIDNTSYAYAGSDSDTRMHLSAEDLFVPRVTAGTTIGPIQGFEVGGVFSYTADFHAEGSIHVTGDFNLSSSSTVSIDQVVRGVSLEVPQTHHLILTLRYMRPLQRDSQTRTTRRSRQHDRLETERFDVEADIGVVWSERVDDVVIRFPEDAVLDAGGVQTPLPDEQAIPRRWKRQLVVRLGGDVAVVPQRFALRLGLGYETDGTVDAYRSIDFTPYERVVVSAGATLRIGNVDISLGYTHAHQPRQFVSPADARLERPLGGLADPVSDAQTINAGVYRTGYDLVALELTYRFTDASK